MSKTNTQRQEVTDSLTEKEIQQTIDKLKNTFTYKFSNIPSEDVEDIVMEVVEKYYLIYSKAKEAGNFYNFIFPYVNGRCKNCTKSRYDTLDEDFEMADEDDDSCDDDVVEQVKAALKREKIDIAKWLQAEECQDRKAAAKLFGMADETSVSRKKRNIVEKVRRMPERYLLTRRVARGIFDEIDKNNINNIIK